MDLYSSPITINKLKLHILIINRPNQMVKS